MATYILTKEKYKKRCDINYAVEVYDNGKLVSSGAINLSELQPWENISTILALSITGRNLYDENSEFKTISKPVDGVEPVNKCYVKEFKKEFRRLSEIVREGERN